jgi:hypothetical protein
MNITWGDARYAGVLGALFFAFHAANVTLAQWLGWTGVPLSQSVPLSTAMAAASTAAVWRWAGNAALPWHQAARISALPFCLFPACVFVVLAVNSFGEGTPLLRSVLLSALVIAGSAVAMTALAALLLKTGTRDGVEPFARSR